MRIRKKIWARPELSQCDYFVREPSLFKGCWGKDFSCEAPIHLDLGCGKGVFLAEVACQNPNINFIGIDISMDILGVARRNIEEVFGDKNVENIRFFSHDIEKITEVFSENDQVDRIYINFCNPWPKSRGHKKRLLHTDFLNKYKTFLKPNGEIWFKTDSDDLYLASLRYLAEADLDIFFSTKDLHAETNIENIRTEHENMFTEQGIKIKAIRAKYFGGGNGEKKN
jgi:tRNA (guanine-N(7)-)-methyltransferase